MEPINSYAELVTRSGGFACGMLCGIGCGLGSAGCGGLCFLDGPAPFADAAAWGAIGTAGAGGAAASTGIAYNI